MSSDATSFMEAGAGYLRNLAVSVDDIYRLITASAYVVGFALAFKALYSLKVYGELRTMMASNTSLKEPLVLLGVSSMFLYMPTGLAIIMNTTFGTNNILAYNELPTGINLTATNGGYALLKILQLIGVIAFIRGFMMIARSSSQGQQPGGMGKGAIHVLGGVMMMNIVGTIAIISNTLGITF